MLNGDDHHSLVSEVEARIYCLMVKVGCIVNPHAPNRK